MVDATVDTTHEVARVSHTSLAHRVAHANRRVAVGAVALIFTIFSLFSPMATQRAHAQTGAEAAAAAVAAAETANKLCEAIYGAGNVKDCVKEIEEAVGEDKDEIKDFGKCVSDELKNPAEDEGEGDTSTGDDVESGDGGDSNSNSEEQGKEGALKKCLDEMDEDEEEDEDTKEAINNLSLYRMGSALTAFYTNNLIPGGPEDSSSSDSDDEDSEDSGDSEGATNSDSGDSETEGTTGLKAWKKLLSSPAMAGGFLAAPNDDFQESQKWMFGAGGGVNDATLSYSSVDRSDEFDADDAGVSKYGYFGAMLAGLGLDSTSSSGTVDGVVSSTGGVFMLAAYTVAGAVDTIFDTFLELLQTLNPFRLLTDALTKDSGSSFASGMPSAAEGEHGMFDDLREFLGDMYTGFVQLGWLVTVPVLIGFTAMAIVLSRRFNASDGIKKLAIRIAFIGVGIPLLGSTYTGALESMQGASGDSAKANATKVVMSTYVDFEGWTDTRLQLPTHELREQGFSGIGGNGAVFGWDKEANTPTDTAQARVRKTASSINAMVANAQDNKDVADVLKSRNGSGSHGDAQFNSDTVTEGKELERSNGNATGAYKYTADLLRRYIKGDRVSSSDYEGRVKGGIHAWAGDDKDRQKTARAWVQDFTDANSLQGMDDEAVADLSNPLIQVDENSGLKTQPGGYGEVGFDNSAEGVEGCKPDDIAKLEDAGDGKVTLPSCNLSALAMYNYLNTDFGSTSMRMYSPDKSTSTFQRVEHNSVTPVGSGLMQYIYWFSAMTLLISFAIIGIIYGITLVFSSIRRGIQLIMAIPFGLMGFIAGASKAVIYTIAMFLEIFLTLFAYKVIQEFMMAIPALIETPLVEHLSSEESKTIAGGIGLGALAAGTSNPATVVLIVTLLSTIGIIIFTMLAIKLRGSIVSAMEEAVTQAINKVVGTGVSSGREPGQSGIKQGLARGAGLGATHAVMSDGKSGGGDGAADSVADAADSGDATGAGAAAGGAAGAAAGLGGTAMAGDMPGDGEAGMTDVDAEGSDAEFSNAAFSDGGGAVEGIDGDIDGDVDGGYLDAGQDYDVDANGGMVDADGNPVMVGEGDDARQVGLGDLGDFDAQGQLVGDDGNPVIGEDGNPVTASDIHGVNSDGYFTDADGAPIMTADGSPIKADGVGGTNVGEGQSAESMTVGESAGSDEAVAEQVANEGGLQFASADSSATPTFATGGAEGAPEAQSGMDKAMGTVDEVANKAADSEALSGTGAGAVAGAVAGRGTGRSLADNMHTLSDNLNQNVAQARAAQAGHTPVENISNALHGQTGAAPVDGQQASHAQATPYRQVSDSAPLHSARGAQPVDGSDTARMMAAGMAGSLATRGANKVMNSRSKTMRESVTGNRSQSGGQSGGGGSQSPRGGRRRGGRTGSIAGQAAQSAALSQGVRRSGNRQGSGRHSQQGHGGHGQQGHGHSPQSGGRHHRGDEGGIIST